MGRNNRAKKRKKTKPETITALTSGKPFPEGEKVYVLTESELHEMVMENSKQFIDGVKALVEYNLIMDNHLTPEQAREQSNLMEIRSEAIINGNLTWEEIYRHIDEFHAKEE